MLDFEWSGSELVSSNAVDKTECYQLFRYSNAFHFLTAKTIIEKIVEHSTLIACKYGFENEKYRKLFKESPLGWNESDRKKIVAGKISSLSISHLYFAYMLFRHIPISSIGRVIEIGGGYGGLAYTLGTIEPRFFVDYTIIDIPKVSNLQEWFLSKNFPNQVTQNAGIKSRFNVIDTNSLDTIGHGNYDLFIATHSLSELPPETINFYLENFGFKSYYIYLSMQLCMHAKYDLQFLPEKIKENGYQIVDLDITEGLNVLNVLFKKLPTN